MDASPKFKKENRELANGEVNMVPGFVGDEATEILAYNAVPVWA